MKKYQKLYQLKQIVKAYQEWSKYARLTRKDKYPKEYDAKYSVAKSKYDELTKEFPVKLSMWDNTGRLLNVAYSLLNGKKYFQIECSVRKYNQIKDYEWKKIVGIMEAFKDEENTNEIPTSPFPITQVNEPKEAKEVEVSNE